MSQENDFLANVKVEGTPFEFDKETETPSESPAETKQEEAKPEEGVQAGEPVNTPVKDVPFHEHPRWKEREEELKELRAFKDEAMPKLSALEERITAPKGDTNIPKWFCTLYGENAEAWEQYQEHTKEEREILKNEAIKSIKEEQFQAQQEEQKWLTWVEEGVQKLKDKGYQFEKNELLKAVLDYGPTDTQGNYDFEKAYQILQATKVAPIQNTEAKKKIADMSQGKSGDTTKKDYVTTADLRGKSFNQLIN